MFRPVNSTGVEEVVELVELELIPLQFLLPRVLPICSISFLTTSSLIIFCTENFVMDQNIKMDPWNSDCGGRALGIIKSYVQLRLPDGKVLVSQIRLLSSSTTLSSFSSKY
jgi:hypothetical protein